jgi:hypothetical protein
MRPGYYTAGRPSGHNAPTLIQRGEHNPTNQLQAVSSPDGTAGGGASYPNIAGASGVVSPLVSRNWNAQASPGESQQLVITSASQLPSGTHGVVYGGAALTASGGLGVQNWALATGSSLPAGLSLLSAGAISGTPSTARSYSFFVRVTDVAGNVGTKMFSLAVN